MLARIVWVNAIGPTPVAQTTNEASIVLIFFVFLSITFTPVFVTYIYTHARACKIGKEVSERQKIARRLLDCISITSFTR